MMQVCVQKKQHRFLIDDYLLQIDYSGGGGGNFAPYVYMYVYKGQTLCTTYPTTTKIALRLCSRLSMNGNDIKVHPEGENRGFCSYIVPL